MRDVIFMIDNDQDFKKFILSMESKLPAQSKPTEIRYEKHPVRGTSAHVIFGESLKLTCSQVLFTGAHSPYAAPSTPSGAPPGSQSGLPGLQREASNQSQPPTKGYGAVIQQPAIIPQPQLGYNPQQLQPPQNNNSYVPELPRDKPVFGVSLDHLLDRDGLAVPIIVYQCIQAVDLYGLNVEGIYRIPGTKPHIDRIKDIFDNGE